MISNRGFYHVTRGSFDFGRVAPSAQDDGAVPVTCNLSPVFHLCTARSFQIPFAMSEAYTKFD